ncbi:unnamed protein product [Clonostachys rosea f. rosea IK726]|uniref:Uncharacterized protein n=1 Tax=Clonostachys rosea f. rosea IK726 TaxID=1349383 RepID=A0ACA9TAD1_BIOOC|nr:unnamed protein product [Clonostachys rosea f. rosea IK726]
MNDGPFLSHFHLKPILPVSYGPNTQALFSSESHALHSNQECATDLSMLARARLIGKPGERHSLSRTAFGPIGDQQAVH